LIISNTTGLGVPKPGGCRSGAQVVAAEGEVSDVVSRDQVADVELEVTQVRPAEQSRAEQGPGGPAL
jgi:hypothetical protein